MKSKNTKNQKPASRLDINASASGCWSVSTGSKDANVSSSTENALIKVLQFAADQEISLDVPRYKMPVRDVKI